MEMIEAAGTGIAVGNAHPELKKIADICGQHHNDHAVAHIIRCLMDKGDLKACIKSSSVED